MKHLITLSLLSACLTASAQTLPKEVTIKLTDKQVIMIDSALKVAHRNIDSKGVSQFIIEQFTPLYNQVTQHIVADKPKVGGKP